MYPRRTIRFEAFELDIVARELRRNGVPVAVHPTPLAVLIHLVERPGKVVTKDELLDAVWPDRIISESTLTTTIGDVRKALDDQAGLIETVRGRGFRFSADPLSNLDQVMPPFPAYDGDEPYVFVCYAHVDGADVYAELVRLNDLGYNLWYDEGISPAAEWTEEIAKAINGCTHFLYYVSPAAVTSRNCRNEVQFALSRGKHVIAVHLEETELPAGLELSVGSEQAILKYVIARTDYERKLDIALTGPSRPRGDDGSAAGVASAPSPPRRRSLYTALAALALFIGAVFLVPWRELSTTNEPPSLPGYHPAAWALDPRHNFRFAVLPFEDLTGAPEVAQFADRLVEEMTSYLGEPGLQLHDEPLPEYAVVSARAAFEFRGRTDVRAIGEELDVSYLVTGDVDREGDGLRFNFRLVRTFDAEHVDSWSFQFSEGDALSELGFFAARKLSDVKSVALVPIANVVHQTDNTQAMAEFLRGYYARNVETRMAHYKKAVEVDPGMYHPYIFITNVILGPPWDAPGNLVPGTLAEAESAIEKAIANWPTWPRAKLVAAKVAMYKLDYRAARQRLAECFDIRPGYERCALRLGMLELRLGNIQAALQAFMRVPPVREPGSGRLRLDGPQPDSAFYRGQALRMLGQHEEALAAYDDVVFLTRFDSPVGDDVLWRFSAMRSKAELLLERGEIEAAARLVDECMAIAEQVPPLLTNLPYVLAKLGRQDEAQAILDRMLNGELTADPFLFVLAYLGLDEIDNALDHVERGLEVNPFFMTQYLRTPLYFGVLKDHPRYRGILENLKVRERV